MLQLHSSMYFGEELKMEFQENKDIFLCQTFHSGSLQTHFWTWLGSVQSHRSSVRPFQTSSSKCSPRLPAGPSSPVGRNRFDLGERVSVWNSDRLMWRKCFCLTLGVHAGSDGGSRWQRGLLPGLSWSAPAFMCLLFWANRQTTQNSLKRNKTGTCWLHCGFFFFFLILSFDQSHFQPAEWVD